MQSGVLGQSWPSDKGTREIFCQLQTSDDLGWGGAFQKYNAVSPPGFKHFVIVKYFTAEGLKPHLARAAARASLNSIRSRD